VLSPPGGSRRPLAVVRDSVAVDHDHARGGMDGLGRWRSPRRGACPAGRSAGGETGRTAAVRAVGARVLLPHALEVPVCAPSATVAAAAGLRGYVAAERGGRVVARGVVEWREGDALAFAFVGIGYCTLLVRVDNE